MQNSCNPAFIQLGKRIGADTFYKYMNAFGLFSKTNISTSGEVTGLYFSSVGPVELATVSFGQRFTITPIQLISAVSAIANNGVLMQPRIVKQIENPDTNIVTMLSRVTCSLCGKISKNSTGKYVAWKTKSWIAYFCKDCFKLNQLQDFKYKADIHKSMLKEYIRECRIEHSKYFILSHHYKDKHTRTYLVDDGNGWLKVSKKETVKEKK